MDVIKRLLGQTEGEVDDHTRLWLEIDLRRAIERAIVTGLSACDTEGTQVYVNEVFCAQVGWPAEKLVGARPPFVYWPPEEIARNSEAFAQTLAGKAPREGYELVFMRQTGERFHVRVRMAEHALSSTRTVYLAAVSDIDQSKKANQALKRSEQVYRAIGESLNYGIWICDAKGRNTYASPSFLNLVGITQEECSEFGWGRFLHPDDLDETMAAWKRCVQEGTLWEREHRFWGRDGQWHAILARGIPIRDDDGTIVNWVGINLDIQALKEAEGALRESDRRKDEFIAVLAHELRNPLAPLMTSLELLTEDHSPSRVEHVLPIMRRQVNHMVRLVDDLLEINRISRGLTELQREPVFLEDVVQAAVDAVKPSVTGLGHELRVSVPDEPVQFNADSVRITQALINVLDNAAKYTPRGGIIALHGALDTEGDSPEVVIRIRDTGVGVHHDSLRSIFDMFTRLDRTAGAGLGIGLSLVRSIVELHGGSVEAHSDGEGQGLEVELRLPASLESRATVDRTRSPAAQPRRLLVIDDNEDAADTLAALLSHHGHTVDVVYDGPSALRHLGQQPYDIALVDLGMPGMDGFAVASAVRSDDSLRGTALVALTGWGRQEDQERTRQAGFNAHLTKPVQLTELFATFERLRSRSSS